ncbi:hypothetical protein NDU88_000161 [Pleurodeles waltl]|uniref:Uncharacterized protein n=1 Tax=Pleurodeles waltl TaxID=8319 RepID=A0AAV7LVM6_PLEWA|nr:hypothetical protein NDU88_000161 [Pleurodeles waltl]
MEPGSRSQPNTDTCTLYPKVRIFCIRCLKMALAGLEWIRAEMPVTERSLRNRAIAPSIAPFTSTMRTTEVKRRPRTAHQCPPEATYDLGRSLEEG